MFIISHERIIELLFWLSAAAIAFSYAIYAPLIWLLSRAFGKTLRAPAKSDLALPSVSLLICAHKEEAVIEQRIRNALTLDYPREKIEIVIASDGSTDATASIVRSFAHHGVRLMEFADRRGKSSVLNDVIPKLIGEIVLLSDANTDIDSQAVRALMRWFSVPEVGVVCGKLVLTDPSTGRNVDGLYWKYETFLKRCESKLGALLGSNGAIYAIRKSICPRIPPGTLVDDFVIPLLAKQTTGCAIVYDTEATAREETPKNIASEFHRRARIGAGGFQSVLLLWRLLDPRRGWVALTFFSHKILRWLCPFFMVAMVVTNALLLAIPAYRAIAIAQVAFYLLSIFAGLIPASARSLRPLRLTTMFTVMNAALFVGFFRWLGGIDGGAWRRTER